MGRVERPMLGNQFEGENHAARRYVKMCTVLDPRDEWIPGLGQYLPPVDEWVPGLGQYLPPRR